MATNKSKAKSKKSAAKAKSKPDKTQGDHVRMLASKPAVRNYINEIIAAKNQTSTVGQDVSSATKRAQNAGVNVPAARLAVRFVSKAKADPATARVMYEDFMYYLEECMDFDKLAPVGMFSAEETRSIKNGKDSRKKKDEQTDLEEKIEKMGGEPDAAMSGEEPMSDQVH